MLYRNSALKRKLWDGTCNNRVWRRPKVEKCHGALPGNELVYKIPPKKAAGLDGCQLVMPGIINILEPSLLTIKHFDESESMKHVSSCGSPYLLFNLCRNLWNDFCELRGACLCYAWKEMRTNWKLCNPSIDS